MATVRELANVGSQQALGTLDQKMQIGSKIYGRPMFFEGPVNASDVLVLPASAKAAVLLDAFRSVGATVGVTTVVLPGAAIATTECGINAAGDVEFEDVTDQVTRAEVNYLPYEGDLITEQIVVLATDIGTLLQGKQGVQLISVNVDAGAITGPAVLELRGATPGALEVALSAAGNTLIFHADIEATLATVTYIAAPGIGTGVSDALHTILDATFPST